MQVCYTERHREYRKERRSMRYTNAFRVQQNFSWLLTILSSSLTLFITVTMPIFRLPEQPCPPCVGASCMISTCFDAANIAPNKTLWQIATLTANFIPVYCIGIAVVLVIAMFFLKGRAFLVAAALAGAATIAYLYTIITWIMRYNVVNANPRPAHEVTGILLLGGGGILLLVATGIAISRHLMDQPKRQDPAVSQSAEL
jgi:hypothetical protein